MISHTIYSLPSEVRNALDSHIRESHGEHAPYLRSMQRPLRLPNSFNFDAGLTRQQLVTITKCIRRKFRLQGFKTQLVFRRATFFFKQRFGQNFATIPPEIREAIRHKLSDQKSATVIAQEINNSDLVLEHLQGRLIQPIQVKHYAKSYPISCTLTKDEHGVLEESITRILTEKKRCGALHCCLNAKEITQIKHVMEKRYNKLPPTNVIQLTAKKLFSTSSSSFGERGMSNLRPEGRTFTEPLIKHCPIETPPSPPVFPVGIPEEDMPHSPCSYTSESSATRSAYIHHLLDERHSPNAPLEIARSMPAIYWP